MPTSGPDDEVRATPVLHPEPFAPLMRLGELRSVTIGASRRIPQAALADFIADLAQEPR